MKTIVLTFSLLCILISGFTNSLPNREPAVRYAHASFDYVKLFYQPGTSTKILKVLTRSDQFIVHRAHNKTWSIVSMDNLVGYVLTSEINWDSSYKQYISSIPVRK